MAVLSLRHRLLQEGLELGECHLAWVEIGRVWRQIGSDLPYLDAVRAEAIQAARQIMSWVFSMGSPRTEMPL